MILNEEDLSCHAIDGELALFFVKDQKFVLDYSTVMELLQNLAQTASQMEKSLNGGEERQSLQ